MRDAHFRLTHGLRFIEAGGFLLFLAVVPSE